VVSVMSRVMMTTSKDVEVREMSVYNYEQLR
jgi:hypothetical protein